MEVLESEQHLASVELGLSEGELLFLDVKHEISTRHILHHKVDSGLRLETRVQAEQEGVSLLRGGQEDSFLRLSTARVSNVPIWGSRLSHLSTSSFSMMKPFFKTLIAYRLLDVFSSASMTFPKFPLPSTAKKLKSSKPTFRFRAICC